MKRVINTLNEISPFMLSFNILVLGLSLSFATLSEAKPHPASQKTYSFTYKTPTPKPLTLSIQSSDYDSAFKLAAKECYKSLSNGQYPGESRGLAMIDICANPK